MESKGKLILIGTLSGTLLTGCIVLHVHKKNQDRKSAQFYSELERSLQPAGVGLIESDAFDMYYWQNLMKKLKKNYYLLTQAAADAFAKDISDSWGVFSDDEEKIYGVFRALKDQVAVSQVANKYYLKNKINLIDDLRARLSTEEVGEIMNIVSPKPPYRTQEAAPAKK